MRRDKITYKSTGIDINKIHRVQNSIGKIVSLSHSFLTYGKVISGFGHYAGLLEFDNKIFALHTDGVGTKIIVSQMMDRFDTVGIDCIAMNVNDIICVGAVPGGFVDYIAIRIPDSTLLRNIAMGLVKGAKEANVPIIGGETAVVPDLLADNNNAKTFDLVGMAFGVVQNKNELILGNKIRKGDAILGIESSGLHSNGYTLARKVLLSRYSINQFINDMNQTIGDMMLTPTRIYVRPIIELIKKNKTPVHGLLHVTGGSFTKFSRLNKAVDYKLDNLPAPAGIFDLIQREGHIQTKEMYRTFNMGIGYCIVLPQSHVDNAIDIIEKHGMWCSRIGHVEGKGTGQVQVRVLDRNFTL
ncbi:MAG: phosphoribosylformylglycinamidine cyclo-ligase [Nitrososphaeraceae archaeon]